MQSSKGQKGLAKSIYCKIQYNNIIDNTPKYQNILQPILQIIGTKTEYHITQHSFIGSFFELDQALPGHGSVCTH